MFKVIANATVLTVLALCGSLAYGQTTPTPDAIRPAIGLPFRDRPLIDDRDRNSGLAEHKSTSAPERLNTPAPEPSAETEHRRPRPGDWLEAQVFFIVWGMVATTLALVICPRASLMTVASIENEPLRCTALGAAGLLAIGLFNVVNTVLFSAALWTPFGVLFFMFSIVIFIFSGILGVVFIGSGVARRFGWHGLGFFGRAATGFATLAILNCLPLAGMASMGLQCVAVLCGLGGLIVTGFGSDPHWLTRILSGNRPK